MTKLLGVRGGLSVDHLVAVGQCAQFNQLGGPGLYGALGGRLIDGVTVRLSAHLPADDLRFADLFARLGVDIRFCSPVTSAPRVWVLNSPEGRRIVETTAPGSVEIEMGGDAAAEVEQPARPDFLSGLDALLDSAPLQRVPVDDRIPVGIDPHQVSLRRDGIEYLRSVTPKCAVVLPSRIQLSLVNHDVREAARRISSELETPVIARLDRDGLLVVDESGEWEVRDRNVTVRETTGAGDASAAAIMGAFAIGADPVAAAMFGASVARVTLAGPGPATLLDAAPITTPFNGITSTNRR